MHDERERELLMQNGLPDAALSSGTRPPRSAGLTLVELMIAIALMLIMTLQLQIIFSRGRQLFLGADAMAQVYSNARAALDQIERDIANAVKSDQMEFYNDNRSVPLGLGHYNQGEMNGTVSGRFLPGRYINSFCVKQPKDYTPKDQNKVGGPYRNDALYFRTFTTVNGEAREALVEYRLWLGADPNNARPRPILQRVVTSARQDPGTGNPIFQNGYPVLEQQDPQDVCYYVQEFKVDMFIRDRRKRTVGRFYSPKEAIQRAATADDAFPPGMKNLLSGENFAVQCLEGGDDIDPLAVMQKDDRKLHLKNGDRVARLKPGDKMYIVTRQIGMTRRDFGANYLTIKDIVMPSAQETVISFEEDDIIKSELGGSTMPPFIDVAYRAAWLPQAIRIQMKIKDTRSQEIRTISRIFQLLRA